MKTIISTDSKYLNVSNSPSPLYVDITRPSAGLVRISGVNMEVFDGIQWVVVSPDFCHISLHPDAENLLDWVKQKKQEELLEDELRNKYPSLKQAHENYKMIRDIVKHE